MGRGEVRHFNSGSLRSPTQKRKFPWIDRVRRVEATHSAHFIPDMFASSFPSAVRLAMWISFTTEILQPDTVPRPAPATRRHMVQEHLLTHRDDPRGRRPTRPTRCRAGDCSGKQRLHERKYNTIQSWKRIPLQSAASCSEGSQSGQLSPKPEFQHVSSSLSFTFPLPPISRRHRNIATSPGTKLTSARTSRAAK